MPQECNKIAQWADVFPNLRNSATEDPRIFQTPWIKQIDKSKKKTFFACVVGADCYGVDVIKPWAKEDKSALKSAMAKMKRACYTYQETGQWPKA